MSYIGPEQQAQLLHERWLKESDRSEGRDGDPDTARLMWETKLFLGIDTVAAREALAEMDAWENGSRS